MKKLLLFFLFVTAVNAGLFIFRDPLQYVRYSTYEELYAPCDEACNQKWGEFLHAYSGASLAEARRLLQPLRSDPASTLTRIEAIGHHLYTKFNGQAGYPQGIIHTAAPLDLYKILSADTAQKVWCGTYAMLFAFFCWSQNVVCRVVEIYRPGDHHMLNECWVPETKQWMLVDLTANVAGAEADGQLLNTQNFVKALAKPSGLYIISAGNGQRRPCSAEQKAVLESYYRPAYPFVYYHLTQPGLLYRPLEKIKRYFLPHYWYEIFSPEGKSNVLFWAKPFFAALWLILAGLLFLKRFSK